MNQIVDSHIHAELILIILFIRIKGFDIFLIMRLNGCAKSLNPLPIIRTVWRPD